MVEICFCADGCATVYRSWSTVPHVGDTVAFPVQSATNSRLTVSEVIWEGTAEPDVTILLGRHQGRTPDIETNGLDPRHYA